MRMSEESAAELAAAMSVSKTDTTEQAAESAMQDPIVLEATHDVSNVSKLVSFGYNLIRGCPEGEFESGGMDVGIRSTNQIFKFTFDKGKVDSYVDSTLSQPDQVDYIPRTVYTLLTADNVYGGGKSYRDTVTTAVTAAGKSPAMRFIMQGSRF